MKWLALLLIVGCAQVTSLNLKKHQFGLQPTKIIWFQVAGLEEEQIAFLRFEESAERRTSFENNTCLGNTWNYNLYALRSPAHSTFMSQLTGSKNIKLDCSDAEHRPIWSYLGGTGYSTGILEIFASPSQSLVGISQCPNSTFTENVYFWLRQEPPKDASTYIYSQPLKLKLNERYYDRTCSGKKCDSTITENFQAITQHLDKVNDKQLFILRDFSYLEAMEKKDFLKARGILADLERAYGEALNLAKNSNDYLVLLTTGDSKFVDLPNMGKSWVEFVKKGTGANMKRTKLTNLVLASGARAENFCGMYEDAQVFERILSGPKQQGLEFKFLNPFKL